MKTFARRYLHAPQLGDTFLKTGKMTGRIYTAIVVGVTPDSVAVRYNFGGGSDLTYSRSDYVRYARNSLRNAFHFIR